MKVRKRRLTRASPASTQSDTKRKSDMAGGRNVKLREVKSWTDGQWIESNDFVNSKFKFTLENPSTKKSEEESTVIVSLAQKPDEGRCREKHMIGLQIYEIVEGRSRVAGSGRNANTTFYRNDREVSKRMRLPPGKYVIAACSHTSNPKPLRAKFHLRLFGDRKWITIPEENHEK